MIEYFQIAEKMFQKAIELDSNFVLAYTRLAQTNLFFYWFYWDRTDNRLRKSKYYIDKALEINPDLAEIYMALGQYYYYGFLNYDRALYEFNKGLKIKPNYEEILIFIGLVKRRQGKFEEAISYMIKSLELDPLTLTNLEISSTYFLIKKYEESEKYSDKAISLTPDWGSPFFYKAKAHIFRNGDVNRAYKILKNSLDIVIQEKRRVISLLVQVQIFSGKYEEALKTLSDESLEVFEDQFTFLPKSQLLAIIHGLENNKSLENAYYDSARVVIKSELEKLPDDARLHSALGLVLAGLGKKEESIKEGKLAVKLIPVTKEAWRGFHRELDLAKIYTMVGEYDLAIQKLDYLLSIPGELSVPYIKIDPVWQDLLELPRMKEVLKKYQ
jgi:tetratricopeptide (TPR) repeat protein